MKEIILFFLFRWVSVVFPLSSPGKKQTTRDSLTSVQSPDYPFLNGDNIQSGNIKPLCKHCPHLGISQLS
jgi:hypothetical protein